MHDIETGSGALRNIYRQHRAYQALFSGLRIPKPSLNVVNGANKLIPRSTIVVNRRRNLGVP